MTLPACLRMPACLPRPHLPACLALTCPPASLRMYACLPHPHLPACLPACLQKYVAVMVCGPGAMVDEVCMGVGGVMVCGPGAMVDEVCMGVRAGMLVRAGVQQV